MIHPTNTQFSVIRLNFLLRCVNDTEGVKNVNYLRKIYLEFENAVACQWVSLAKKLEWEDFV